LSDAPAHSVFVLLSPSAEKDVDSLPDILAVVQVALEGRISRKAVEAQLARGHRSAGDLIPWTISQQFGDSKFAQLSGARIVRIAVHPSVQSMGYGTRAVELLYRFYNGEMVSLDHPEHEESDDDDNDSSTGEQDQTDEESLPDMNEPSNGSKGIQAERLVPRKELPPLLLPLTEIDAPRLDWVGTSFGLTLSLHKFWSKACMQMLYLRQTKNELTGEHSAIMIRALPKTSGVDDKWLDAFVNDTKRRFVSLLSGSFRDMPIRLAISVLEKMAECKDVVDRAGNASGKIKAEELSYLMTPHDMKRLELYGRNLCDHHLVTDLLPTIARLYFTGRFGEDFKLSSAQAAIVCGIGVQNRDVDAMTSELGLPSNQVLAMFNKAVRKMSIALNVIIEEKEKGSLLGGEERRKVQDVVRKMGDVASKTLEEDAAEAATEAIQLMNDLEEKSLPPDIAKDASLMQYVVKGTDGQWGKALEGHGVGETGTVSIRGVRKKRRSVEEEDYEKEAKLEQKGKQKQKRKRPKK
jgi:N-acetyltransferase 10